MSDFVIGDFLVVFPVFVVCNGIIWTGDQGSARGFGYVNADDDEKALAVFTDYDLAYDFMSLNFPNDPEAKVVTLENKEALAGLLSDMRFPIYESDKNNVVFDVNLASSSDMTFYEIDDVIEAVFDDEGVDNDEEESEGI